MLKKSYTGFILWMAAYIGILFFLAFLPIDNDGVMIRLIFGFTALAVTVMILMIYLSEKVYWINGVTYEQAVEAGSERRKLFALRHLSRFAVFTAIYALYAVVGQIVGIPFWIDFILFTAGMIAAAVSTIGIRL